MSLKRYTKEEDKFFEGIVNDYRTSTLPTEHLKSWYITFCTKFFGSEEQDHGYTLSQFSAKYYDMRRKILGLSSPGYTKSSPAEKEVISSVKKLVEETKALTQENKELKLELRKLKEIRQAVENYQKNK